MTSPDPVEDDDDRSWSQPHHPRYPHYEPSGPGRHPVPPGTGPAIPRSRFLSTPFPGNQRLALILTIVGAVLLLACIAGIVGVLLWGRHAIDNGPGAPPQRIFLSQPADRW